jgi:hypothetical protein
MVTPKPGANLTNLLAPQGASPEATRLEEPAPSRARGRSSERVEANWNVLRDASPDHSPGISGSSGRGRCVYRRLLGSYGE